MVKKIVLLKRVREYTACTIFHLWQIKHTAPAGVAQWLGALSRTPNGHKSNSQVGHMPRLWVWSLAGAPMRGNRSMFLSRIDFSLPPFPSKISKHVIE